MAMVIIMVMSMKTKTMTTAMDTGTVMVMDIAMETLQMKAVQMLISLPPQLDEALK